ncbi:MAG: SDR family oxidoreductase [Oscillospiraceae bacterium]
MGIYAITGGSSGIGACTADILRQKGHQVINIDLKGGDITANLAKKDDRTAAVRQLHEMCPDGLDGMICNAGVMGDNASIPLIISVNYFGAVDIATGVFDLLQKRHGSCVVLSSNTVSQGGARMDVVGLLNNQADEERILKLVSNLEPGTSHAFYAATKYALARWARRVSANWGAKGVRVNAVAPGNVRTAMTSKLTPAHRAAMEALQVPINYGSEPLMDPTDIGNAIAFLASPEAHGINGVVLFVDGGTDALLNSEKVY